mgnify:CR=1 FL=1
MQAEEIVPAEEGMHVQIGQAGIDSAIFTFDAHGKRVGLQIEIGQILKNALGKIIAQFQAVFLADLRLIEPAQFQLQGLVRLVRRRVRFVSRHVVIVLDTEAAGDGPGLLAVVLGGSRLHGHGEYAGRRHGGCRSVKNH